MIEMDTSSAASCIQAVYNAIPSMVAISCSLEVGKSLSDVYRSRTRYPIYEALPAKRELALFTRMIMTSIQLWFAPATP